jgi:DNA-binding IclR family transcriptional regulator
MATNKSTLRAVEMLDLLAARQELTLSEIAEALTMPMASASDILKALLKTQMVEIANQRAKTYRIGVKNFFIGNKYLEGIDIVELSKPVMEKLSAETSNTVFLAKQVDSEIIYLHKTQPGGMIVSTCQIGSKAGLSVTALGKVILAYNEELQREVFAKPLPAPTEFSITDPAELKAQLAEIKASRHSFDKFENDERVACIGFPIFNHMGRVEYSISISGTYFEYRNIEHEIRLGHEAAAQISTRLGFAG